MLYFIQIKIGTQKEFKMENRKKRSLIVQIFSFVAIGVMLMAGGVIIGELITKRIQAPTVYMTYGDKDTCDNAIDVQGKEITCAEAMKRGRYHVVYIAPKSLSKK
jgi:hypothetical protein